jgi:hypothetical protein
MGAFKNDAGKAAIAAFRGKNRAEMADKTCLIVLRLL